MSMRRLFVILVIALLVLPGAFGQAETFTVNPGQSAFSMADVLHSVHGAME